MDIKSTTFFLGAGASVEAGIPAALPLAEHIIRVIVESPWAQDELVSRLPYSTSRSNREMLRFEQALEWVSEVFDHNLDVLSFLDLYNRPTRIHLAVADACRQGARVATVNFDSLQELAIEESGSFAISVDAHNSSPEVLPRSPHVLKLHGSREWFGGCPGSGPQATIDRIMSSSPGLRLNTVAESTLKSWIDGRELIVAGYSASDDLDIVPSLHRTQPTRVVWFDWESTPPQLVPERVWRTENLPWVSLLTSWEASGTQVEVVRGETAIGLELPGLSVPRRQTPSVVDWKHEIHDWMKDVRFQDPSGMGFAGLVFGDLELGELSADAFRESVSSSGPGATWTRQRREYEVAQALLLKTPSEIDSALRHATEALDLAARHGTMEDQLYSNLLVGRTLFLSNPGKPNLALEYLDTAFDMATPGTGEWAFVAERRANVLARSGEPAKALRLANKSAMIYSHEGLLANEIDALVVAATAAGNLGKWSVTATALARAIALAVPLGYAERLFELEEIEASHLWSRGELDHAIETARQALANLNGASHDEEALAHRTVALCLLEQGNHKEASREFTEATELVTTVTAGLEFDLTLYRAECEILLGNLTGAHNLVDRAALTGTGSWADATHLSCVRFALDKGSSTPTRSVVSLGSYPRGVSPSTRLEVGMSVARLGVDTRGARIALYRAEQAATKLSSTTRSSYLGRIRRALAG